MCVMIQLNDEITDSKVLLVLEDGSKVGVIAIGEAKRIAQNKNLDLFKITESTPVSPAVCKLVNYEKFKYLQSKQEKKNHKHHNNEIKEIRIGGNIASHDLEVKVKKIAEFIDKHFQVKVVYCTFLRSNAAQVLSSTQLKEIVASSEVSLRQILSRFKDSASWDKISKNDGRQKGYFTISLSVVLKPHHLKDEK